MLLLYLITSGNAVVPVNGKVNVRLTNKTNDRLFYQVVGQSNRRSLAENSTVALQALTLPASIVFRRPDGALLKPSWKPVGEGTVELRLDETKDLDLDKRSLTIRNDQEFLDGTSPRIYPWNQSKISNLKSSSPRIYPWGKSKI